MKIWRLEAKTVFDDIAEEKPLAIDNEKTTSEQINENSDFKLEEYWRRILGSTVNSKDNDARSQDAKGNRVIQYAFGREQLLRVKQSVVLRRLHRLIRLSVRAQRHFWYYRRPETLLWPFLREVGEHKRWQDGSQRPKDLRHRWHERTFRSTSSPDTWRTATVLTSPPYRSSRSVCLLISSSSCGH